MMCVSYECLTVSALPSVKYPLETLKEIISDLWGSGFQKLCCAQV